MAEDLLERIFQHHMMQSWVFSVFLFSHLIRLKPVLFQKCTISKVFRVEGAIGTTEVVQVPSTTGTCTWMNTILILLRQSVELNLLVLHSVFLIFCFL